MAYKFYTDHNKHTAEKQAYAAYMIVSSYYHHAFCRNPFLLARLGLHYREAGVGEQEKMELQMIEEMEKIAVTCREVLACMNCEVTISRRWSVGKEGYELCFETGFECIRVVINGKKKPEIRLER